MAFCLLWASWSTANDRNVILDVRTFGAKGDAETLDSAAIQAAINVCAGSGGRVVIPPGTYLSGTIVLKSHVELHIMAGATLLGSTNIEDYPAKTVDIPSYNDSFLRQSLIFAAGQENISITGMGTIDGQGASFKVTTNKKPDRYRNRPFGLRIVACRNVLVEDVTMRSSAMWMQQYFACDGVTIRGIKVYNHSNKNNDMIDIDSSRNVVMSDCFGDTDDDAITIKSTTGKVAENITITNCVISSHVNAIKLGTESHGGFRNITISNIVIRPSAHDSLIYGQPKGIGGITLGIVDGGILDGIQITNIRMDGPETPIFMRLGDRGRTYYEEQPRPDVGIFRNVSISNVIATGAGDTGCSITGIPGHAIQNITLSDIRILFQGGGTTEDAAKVVPENIAEYPGSGIFGKLPAYGFYFRHVNHVGFNNIDLGSERPDNRPALICDDVEGLDISGLRAYGPPEDQALIRLTDSRDVFIHGSRPYNPVDLFLRVEGSKSRNITLAGNDLNRVTKIYEFKEDVDHDALRISDHTGP